MRQSPLAKRVEGIVRVGTQKRDGCAGLAQADSPKADGQEEKAES